MTGNSWLAKPHQTEPRILEWAQEHPQWTQLDTVRPWSHTVYAITVTDRRVPDEGKRKGLFAVPHGHEPAGTVACMNVLSQLLDGCELDGMPTTLDRETILRETLLTFIPDANPEGRSRSPEDWWDGSKYTNEEFLKFAFGVDTSTGERFKRVDRWRTTEENVSLVGIAYERIDETTYVEPNRDWGSSFFRLIHLLTARHRYDQFLDLHQTEFERSPHNCVILLPVLWEELPAVIRATSQTWADEITEAWRQMENAAPQPPRVLGYTGQQRAYLEQRWGALYRTYPHLTVEVQNNNPRTPADLQRRLSETAIRVSIERLL
jgi:hypothetical protein